jgi:hypothetical protein
METSGIAANADDLAAGMTAAANDWQAEVAALSSQLAAAREALGNVIPAPDAFNCLHKWGGICHMCERARAALDGLGEKKA